MTTVYTATTLDANIYQDLELELEIDTDEIASEVADNLDIEEKVQEALSEPDSLLALAQGIIDLNEARGAALARNRELAEKSVELNKRISALETELLQAQEMATKPSSTSEACSGDCE